MLAHDPSLVLLSISVAVLGAFTASLLTSGVLSLPRDEARLRLIMAGFALGGSVWATNFVGLLAIEAPINWTENPLLVAVSGTVGFVSTYVALFLIGYQGVSSPLFPAAVAIFGLGTAATHYLGLLAVGGAGLQLTWFLMAIAITTALQVAALGLWFLLKRRGVVITLFGSVIFGLAIAATHYIAVASAVDLDATLMAVPPDASGLSERYLAWSATIMMYLICSICCCIFVIMQFRDDLR